MVSKGEILDRLSVHADDDQKSVLYGLRMVAANFLDISSSETGGKPLRTDGKWNDVVKRNWEEGRHNTISADTHIQVKSMVFSEPEVRWKDVPWQTNLVRQAWYLDFWRRENLATVYRSKLLDILVCGAGTVQVGVREGKLFCEHVDALDVTWDTAYKEPNRKRFAFRDYHLPKSVALRMYPNLTQHIAAPSPDGRGGEQTVTITCYYDKDTRAVMRGKNFLVDPEQHPFGRIPLTVTPLFQELSVKYSTGMVERSIGLHRLMLTLQRKFREVSLRGAPVGVASGNFKEDDLDRIESGEEGVLLRSQSKDASFKWEAGAELAQQDIVLYQMLEQMSNATSGVDDFQRAQTDTNVKFATQLSLIAAKSGVQSKYTAQIFEDGLRDDIELLMAVAAQVEDSVQVPKTLMVEGTPVTFDGTMPLAPQLGDDGDIVFTPGGMQYQAPAQKLQEAMALAETLGAGAALPPGIAERFIDLALTAYEVDDKDRWLEDMQAAAQAAMQQQVMMQQQEMAMQGQQGGQPAQNALPQQGR